MMLEFDFIPFVRVGPLNFGDISGIPISINGLSRSLNPGGDRYAYGDADVVVMFYRDGLIELITVFAPINVRIAGLSISGIDSFDFFDCVRRLGIVGGSEDGMWVSADRSFSVRFRDEWIEAFTAYSPQYIERGTGFIWNSRVSD